MHKTIEEARDDLLLRGYRDIEEVKGLKVGARVRHIGEQYSSALVLGTGVIRVLMRSQHNQQDIELVVERDDERFGTKLGFWADYHTVLIKEF